MLYRMLLLLPVFSACPLFSSAQKLLLNMDVKNALAKVDSNTIKKDIAYLAGDALRGRLPGTPGYQMAVDYVTQQFKEMGVQPGGDDHSFIQKMVLREARVDSHSIKVTLNDPSGNPDDLTAAGNFILMPNAINPKVQITAPLVFVGYGIEIAGGYSDYKDIDVKGKIVVMLHGSPAALNLHSTVAAHFVNLGSKVSIAAMKGAAGLILVRDTPGGGIGGSITVAMNLDKSAVFGRLSQRGLLFISRMSTALLQRFFMYSDRNFEATMTALKNGKNSSFALTSSLSVSYTSTYKDIESYNVIGKIDGSDPELRNEYVVHTAHLDHVGVGTPVNGDSIYNGAHDNASGTAALLEIARTYQRLKMRPKRSILIVLVTGEEMGLLGSAYFASNPTVPKNRIVADVNTDMPTVIAPLLSVCALGAGHSSLEKNVAFACDQLGLTIEKDPMPEEVRFVRSDQYSFVEQGIPAIHLKYGTKTMNPSFDLVKYTKEWRDKNYHQPSDEIDNDFNYTAAVLYTRLNFLISYSIAQTSARPVWNTGDFFGNLVQAVKE